LKNDNNLMIQGWYQNAQDNTSLSAIQQISDDLTLNLYTPPQEFEHTKKALDQGGLQFNLINNVPVKDSSSQKKRRYKSDLTEDQL